MTSLVPYPSGMIWATTNMASGALAMSLSRNPDRSLVICVAGGNSAMGGTTAMGGSSGSGGSGGSSAKGDSGGGGTNATGGSAATGGTGASDGGPRDAIASHHCRDDQGSRRSLHARHGGF